MTRKTATLTVAGLILAGLLCVALLVPMPYVVMSPGVTENTLGKFDGKDVISIEGHKTYATTGQLDLTTVSVTSPDYEPRLGDVLQAWWAHDEIILPRESVYPAGQTPEESDEQNQTDMVDSQSAAVAVGLGQAGIDAIEVSVAETPQTGPSKGKLVKGDIILTVDGTEVTSSDQSVKLIQEVPPGDEVTLGIERDGKPQDVTITTEPSPDDPSKSRIGVTITTVVDPPFKVNIDLGQDIGGPSAGLMFSLGIYDKITPGELTGGKHVAGTGTLDISGRVGPIGGIQQKIAGAARSGATIFLVPADNCAEAGGSSYKDDVDLVKVSTMDDAVDALNALTAGEGADLARCG
jgi:PDZ domain-containing protein